MPVARSSIVHETEEASELFCALVSVAAVNGIEIENFPLDAPTPLTSCFGDVTVTPYTEEIILWFGFQLRAFELILRFAIGDDASIFEYIHSNDGGSFIALSAATERTGAMLSLMCDIKSVLSVGSGSAREL